MKTLIICGSPRKAGYTVSLINELSKNLVGEIHILYVYDLKYSACIDCRYCNKKIGCIFNDDFSDFLEKLEDCDNFIIASPLNFGGLTGKLMDFFSRFQTYFSNNFLRLEPEKIAIKPKNVALLMVSGSKYPNIDYIARGQYNYILSEVNGCDFGSILLANTDKMTDKSLKTALDKVKNLAFRFNQS